MKKVAFALLYFSIVAFISCGPSEEEHRRQVQVEDSLSKIDGDIAIDRANDILSDTTAADSTITEKDKTKK
ncbi:MAG TPA: hypothetical protein PKK00_04325 [Bacteroidales bacterium]|nr:hypothetical protein [Bacteroidales bacterium]HPS16593.1 hypothetical protein [Bacteroidales bacterium]